MSETSSPAPAPETPLSRIPFTARDEASIRALCNWMQIAAVISIISAIFKVISAFAPQQDLSNLIDAAITFLIGIWVYQAGTAFRKVADTDVADQSYMMEGFSLLRRVFLLQSILVILMLTLLVIALIVVVVVMAAQGGAG